MGRSLPAAQGLGALRPAWQWPRRRVTSDWGAPAAGRKQTHTHTHTKAIQCKAAAQENGHTKVVNYIPRPFLQTLAHWFMKVWGARCEAKLSAASWPALASGQARKWGLPFWPFDHIRSPI